MPTAPIGAPSPPRSTLPAAILLGGLALVAALAAAPPEGPKPDPGKVARLFGRDNLIAWCIVPFDSKKRSPEDRAEMLARLGFKHFAYDWRAEHVPTFDAEMDALKGRGVALDAFWAPGELNDDNRRILDALKRHGLKAQLWVLLDFGADRVEGDEQRKRVEAAVAKLRPLADEAAKADCSVALYNHGGWFGEPENQLAIVEALKGQGVANVGVVYNLHHGHDHLDRFPAALAMLRPHLKAVNLNGMDPGGDRVGRKILPLGQGSLDLGLLKIILDSGYDGPIGILGHTMDDAEERLKDNLDGLDWLLPQLEGHPAGPPPKPRTPVPPRPDEKERVSALIREAREHGDPHRGAEVFASARSACLSCHQVGEQGGKIGPMLATVGCCLAPEEVVESVLWPRRQVKDGYNALAIATDDGKVRQGYKLSETDAELVLRDPGTGEPFRIAKADIEAVREEGSLMPEGLAEAMSPTDLRDLLRFLFDLGLPGSSAADHLAMQAHAHEPAAFAYDRAPLHPEDWPGWQLPVNRDRIYDFYAKEAAFFGKGSSVPPLLPAFPGLDGGKDGHWGNQNEKVWADDRWNRTDLGNVLSGVFRGAGVTVPKGVCVRLGDRGELSACFNPETLCYEALWRDGFVRFSPTRHGFMEGLLLDGSPLPRPEGKAPGVPFAYHGFYRQGNRVVFSYRLGDVEMLDAPWVENGEFRRVVGPAKDHPLASLTQGGGARWPQVLTTRGTLGKSSPYAVDTIEPPFENPWNALMFFGDHDFLPDGSALLCTMQGDVWRVEGLDGTLEHVRWRRYASGLHQALGLVVADGAAYVLGRDQITRLRDLDGDGEADFHECVSNAFETSPAGHDFTCGLQRDAEGRFYTASGKQGLLRISADGRAVEVLATGFRNPDGLGLAPDGTITVPSSEGDWVCASQICQVRPGGHYGYPGPRDNRPPDLPLVYLPRGLDNSSGAQVTAPDDGRFGPLSGQMLHFSFGAGAHFLVLREQVGEQPQGAIIPLPGEFRSGAHRARFNPVDGQLYVSGMAGWGSYTPDDGSFQRVRYTGGPALLPTASHAVENGMLITFAAPIDRELASQAGRHFAQAWNYRYGPGYGSQELSPRHPGQPGHDPLAIRSARVLPDGKTLFLEIPDLQPTNQLHLHLRPDDGRPIDLFATVHKLAPPFTDFPDYRPASKTIAAHPILADLLALTIKPVPNPHKAPIAGARPLAIEAGKNLTFSEKTLKARPGEPIRLTFLNPDVVPHNWTLIKAGSLARVGDLTNKIIAEPDAALRQYIPKSDDVLAYTDIVAPGEQFAISFRAPATPGRYPYLCTFPGHWMVMNGELIVE